MASDVGRHTAIIRDQALHWVFQLHTAEDLTPLLPVFYAWLDAAPEHRQEYLRYEMLWRDLEDLKEESASNEIRGPVAPATAAARWVLRRWRWICAVCISVCVLAGIALALH
jgi:ferric-dicitrate binding protein FerR (iron transport regulator)